MSQMQLDVDADTTVMIFLKAGGTMEIKGPCKVQTVDGGSFIVVHKDDPKPKVWVLNRDFISFVETT